MELNKLFEMCLAMHKSYGELGFSYQQAAILSYIEQRIYENITPQECTAPGGAQTSEYSKR